MASIGIDWGTHSSKFSVHGDKAQALILSSTLFRSGSFLTFPDVDKSPASSAGVLSPRLKKVIVDDPHTSFWIGRRTDTGMSLGHSVVFSLAALLGGVLERAKLLPADINEITFSLPNWSIAREHQSAFRKFKSAAKVAVSLLHSAPEALPIPGKPTEIKAFETAVQPFLPAECEDFMDSTHDAEDRIVVNGLPVNFMPESVVAGLPYLDLIERSSHRQVRRFLIVDVGAGSTDIGYMALWRESASEPFYYVVFPPAPTSPYAGENLTRRLAEKNGGDLLSAEEVKLNCAKDGRLTKELPYIDHEWIPEISRISGEYLAGLGKHSLQKMLVPLTIILTGGSSVVGGLDNAIMKSAEEGMLRNPHFRGSREGVALRATLNPERFSKNSAAEEGRLAVAIGASLPNKSKLVLAESIGSDAWLNGFDSGLEVPRYEMKRPWVL